MLRDFAMAEAATIEQYKHVNFMPNPHEGSGEVRNG